ncbi:MAG: DUF3800 domain-containing protein [Halobacteriales archaeon]|nr:DUF3800 domain-containing protein [Halobacteriales archaeon]
MTLEARFLYLDESGDDGEPPPHGNSPTQHIVYAGIIVTPGQNLELKEGAEYLLSRHFDSKGYERPEELHYGDIINDRGNYKQLDGIEKKELSDDVFDLINQVEPVLMGTVMDKKNQLEKYDNPSHPKAYAFRWTVERFHYYLEEDSTAGMVIADAEEGKIDLILKNLLYEAKYDGISIIKDKGSRIPRIMDSVALTPSEMSPGVQIADFVAYATLSKFERDKGNRFDEIGELWRDPDDSDFREPSLIPE